MRILLLAIVSLLPLAAMAETNSVAVNAPGLALAEQAPAIPVGNWHLIRSDALPTLPAGWVVINMMPLIQNGNSMAAVQIFLRNANTRQNAVWLVGL